MVAKMNDMNCFSTTIAVATAMGASKGYIILSCESHNGLCGAVGAATVAVTACMLILVRGALFVTATGMGGFLLCFAFSLAVFSAVFLVY